MIAVEQVEEREASTDERGLHYLRIFRVDAGRPDADEDRVLAASGLPYRFQRHPSNPWAVANSLRARRVPHHPTLWTVEVHYLTRNSRRAEVLDPDPMKRPVEVQWDTVVEQVPLRQDLDGKAVLNSAGEPFDPPVMDEVAYPVVRITRNEWSFSPALIRDYSFRVNSKPIWGEPAGTVLMRPPRAISVTEGPNEYFRVTYELWFSPDKTWQLELLDQGFSERIEDKLVVMKDDNDTPYNVPQLLKNGRRSAVPAYLTFRRRETVDFTALGLPAL